MYILILTFYAGLLAHTDAVSIASVEFSSKERCVAAGTEAMKLQTVMKSVKFVCVEK